MRCPLWTKYVKNADGSPRPMVDPPIDFIGVSVDGFTVKAPRDNGGGPDARSLRVDEDLDVVRQMYVPHDGQHHTIALTFRRTGEGHYVTQVPLPERICVTPENPDTGAEAFNDARTIADGLNASLGHAQVMSLHMVNMSRGHAVQMRESQSEHLRAILAIYEAQMKASAATNAAVAQAYESRASAFEAQTAGMLAATVDSIKASHAEAMAAARRPGLWERINDFADSPVVEMGLDLAKAGLQKVGGVEGLKSKLGAFVGADAQASAAQELASIGYAAIDRFSDALETKAAIDAGMIDGGGEVGELPDGDDDGAEA